MRTASGPQPTTRPSHPAFVAGAATLVALAFTAAGTPAYAQERPAPPPGDLRVAEPARDDGVEVTWLASGVVPAAQVADHLTGAPAPPGGGSPQVPGALSAGTPGGSTASEEIDDVISNNGCLQKQESEALPHGQNCIDTARIYSSGRVHVHTQVPTEIRVQINDEPALAGSTEGDGPPLWAGLDDEDLSDGAVYDFWTKPFELEYATTYYISAKALDSAGNLSWRYGEYTTPTRIARVHIQNIQVFGDADNGKLNKGEIEFFARVNGTWSLHVPEQGIHSGHHASLPYNLAAFYGATDDTLDIWVQGVENDYCGFNSLAPPPFQDGGGGSVGGNDLHGTCHDYATAKVQLDLSEIEPVTVVYLETDDYYLRFRVKVRIDVLVGK